MQRCENANADKQERHQLHLTLHTSLLYGREKQYVTKEVCTNETKYPNDPLAMRPWERIYEWQ